MLNSYPEQTSMQPQNVYLKFCLASAIFIGAGLAQYFVFQACGLSSRGTPFTNFVDLCTTANVSVIMFKEPNRGYAICGQAPWRKSDIPLDWLQKRMFDNPKEVRGFKGDPHNKAQSDVMPVQTY